MKETSFDFHKLMNSSAYQWSLFIILITMAIKLWFNPNPRKIVSDHVNYIHATLGMGKTALAAWFVYCILHPYNWFHKLLSKILKKPLKPVPGVYSTFELDGAKPLDLANDAWPSERGAIIVIDEILLLESNDLLPIEWFSRGCTLARQLGQKVVLISQASRLPNKLRKFMGTIGLYITMKGISFGSVGRLIFVKRAAEPFVRRSKGFKADGQKFAVMWIPGHVFDSYNSRKIYGYTVDSAGSWIDLDAASNAIGAGRQGDRPEVGAAHVSAAAGGQSGARAVSSKRRVHRVKADPVSEPSRYDW